MCKFFCIRRKKGKLYKFCRFRNCMIETCSGCEDKEYKTYKKQKKHKHKMTQATEIQAGVKAAVWERDGHKCIFCGKYVDKFYANAHFIPRGQGRLRNRRKYFYSMHRLSHSARKWFKYIRIRKGSGNLP